MDLPPDIAKHVAGPMGAASALLFMSGVPWPRRVGMVIAGCILSYYATPAIASWSGLSDGLAGYLLGMFGMAAVAKVHSTIEAMELGALIRKRIASWMGVQE